MLSRLVEHLSVANVTAVLALFVALGGTGYAALALPRNSVGARELRARAVGHPELRPDAVRSDTVRDGALGLRDLSAGARASLIGERGPVGERGPAGVVGAPGRDAVSLWAVVNSSGVKYGGTATATSRPGNGEYRVAFDRSVTGCAYSASIAQVIGDGPPPPPGMITVAEDNGGVRVRTYLNTGALQDTGFHLLVVC